MSEKSPDALLRAATAQVDITPQLPISIAGSLTERVATAVLDPLHARLLLLRAGETSLLFVLLDLIGLSNDDAAAWRRALGEALQLPAAQICVACTHTHSAPTTIDAFESKREAEYLRETQRRVVDAAAKLPAQLQPAQAAWGAGLEGRPQYNRRYIMRDGTLKTNPGKGNPDILHPAGPTDPVLPALLVRANDGTPLAALCSYSLHYVGCDRGDAISADYFGAFDRSLKARYGAQFLGLMAHGASGDINNVNAQARPEPWFPPDASPSQKSAVVGELLASQVETLWQSADFRADVSLAGREISCEQAVRKIAGEEIAQAQREAADATLPHAQRIFARERLLLLEWPDTVTMPLQLWRVGNWAMAAFTGQMFAQFAHDLRYASPFAVTALVELANGSGGYIPRRFDYALGGYEPQLARSSYAAPGTGEELIALAADGLSKLFPVSCKPG